MSGDLRACKATVVVSPPRLEPILALAYHYQRRYVIGEISQPSSLLPIGVRVKQAKNHECLKLATEIVEKLPPEELHAVRGLGVTPRRTVPRSGVLEEQRLLAVSMFSVWRSFKRLDGFFFYVKLLHKRLDGFFFYVKLLDARFHGAEHS